MGLIVTGASGFLGGYVVAVLAARGLSVTAVARREPTTWQQQPPSAVRSVVVADYSAAPVSNSDILIHLAEDATGNEPADDRIRTVQALLAKGARRTVYGSSAIVYGDAATSPRSPDDEITPEGPYALAKRACEELILATSGGVVMRLTNLYGPGMSKQNVLSDILAGLVTPGAIRVQDLAPVRDYLWVVDAAEGVADIAMGSSIGIYNLGTGIGTAVRDLAQAAATAAGEPERAIEGPNNACRSHLVVDISSVAAAFEWRPRVSLAEGLERLIAGQNGVMTERQGEAAPR
jgi:UDP-glucose 4-epimerase